MIKTPKVTKEDLLEEIKNFRISDNNTKLEKLEDDEVYLEAKKKDEPEEKEEIEYEEEPIETEIDSEVEVKDTDEPIEGEDKVDSGITVDSLYSFLNQLLRAKFDEIDQVKSFLVTLQGTQPNEQIDSILENIIDEDTIHIGMFQKALDILKPEFSELQDTGFEKAEDIIGQDYEDELPDEDLSEEEPIEKEEKPIKESRGGGFVRKVGDYSIIDAGDRYVITDKNGANVGETKFGLPVAIDMAQELMDEEIVALEDVDLDDAGDELMESPLISGVINGKVN